VNEQTTHPTPAADMPFQEPVVTQFRTSADLPDLAVGSLALVGGDVFAGTASGVARLKSGDTVFAALSLSGSGAVVDLAVLGGTELVVARKGGVEVLTAAAGAGIVWPVTAGETVAAVAVHGTDVYVGTDEGLSKIDATQETPVAAAQGFVVRDLAVNGDVVWMATAAGVKRYDLAASKLLADLGAPTFLADADVRALAVSGDGQTVLAATATGLSRIHADGSAATLVTPGKGGLPAGDLRAVAESGGEALTGHAIGATATGGTATSHYHSLRWIPAEAITAVALAPDHTRWIATAAGISRIALQAAKLADKAAAIEPLTARHWRMDGFQSDTINYDDPYNLTAMPHRSDDDNDGLWTEMQIAAWCLAYAETKDETYYQNARKAMDVVFLQFDVPGETFAAKGYKRGFITRSLVRDDEGAIYANKATDTRWHAQAFGGRSYYWKDDTSSDEYAGHYFGIPLFYDLCAKTDAEKQQIRDRIALSTSYIVDNGDMLIDISGEPTTFGRWDHLAVAVDGDLGACLASGQPGCVESYGGGGWLNSIEILGHLLAAWHITGDARYYAEYERLHTTERYGDMIPMQSHYFTVTSPATANHSDHELASLAYFTLLRYEPNPDRRAKWQKSLLDFYGYEKEERNALEIGVIASAIADFPDFAAGAGTLQQMPGDFRNWLVDNGHRVDADLDVPDRFMDAQFKTVFPYGEIRTMEWNGNPHAVKGGSAGTSVQAPWPWLLPYWLLRHFKALI
jgi:hypothetical protein